MLSKASGTAALWSLVATMAGLAFGWHRAGCWGVGENLALLIAALQIAKAFMLTGSKFAAELYYVKGGE